jgi:uncharacterized coiled-coil DUF342 family protein
VNDKKSTKKEDVEQLKNAEKKFQSLIEKRNELNQVAKQFRDERDMLNEKRKEIKNDMDRLKDEREKLVLKMKEHKKKETNTNNKPRNSSMQNARKKGMS